MRVLLVSQELPPETGWGGIGTYCSILGPALASAGAEVHHLSVVRGQPDSDTVVDGVHIHRRGLFRPPAVGRVTRLPLSWERITLAVAVRRAAAGLGVAFDVAESPEWHAEGLLLTKRLPVVVRLHSAASQLLPFLGPLGLDERWAISLEERTIRGAALVTGTEAQITMIAADVPLPRSRAVPMPVPRLTPSAIPAGAPTVLFAGRLERRKNPEVLVRAMSKVCAAVPDARLVVVGRDSALEDGRSYAAWLRELARDGGVADSVEVIDTWQKPDALAGRVRAATLMAVPSRWESFGYSAAEAAAAGRPLVTSDLPALRAVVTPGETGLMVPPDDVDGWAGALTDLLTDRSRAASMGQAGAARMATECDPAAVADLTLDAYAAAIGGWSNR